MKGLGNIMQQAQKMQARLLEINKEMEKKTEEASAGGGMVKAVANGKGELVSVLIEKEIINADEKEMLEDLVLAAVNEALRKVQSMKEEEMKKLTGGMKIPGMPGIF
ncbi:MAG: YbaB/EbfC family nucleoid-associated protein [Nitrospinae bacterium]|nr:YbaB/EbfC family nucleoid-associated protein [Nitrospinota bacterium]